MRVQDYVLPQDAESFELEMPQGWEFKSLASLITGLTLFTLEDEHAPKSKELFLLVITDQDRPELDTNPPYFGLCVLQGGNVTKHLFYMGKAPATP